MSTDNGSIDLRSLAIFNTSPPSTVLAATSHTTTAPAQRRSIGHDVDWGLVRALRQQAAEQLADWERDADGVSSEDRREKGRELITDLLGEEVTRAMSKGDALITEHEQNKLAAALFDALFGMGRLQPYIDDTRLENIFVTGDEVLLVHADGLIETADPVSDSDDELIDQIAFLASHIGEGRAFSKTHRSVNLTLDGGHRLAAAAWDVPRPTIAIRRHRLIDIDFDDLATPSNPTMSPMITVDCANFLRAAIRARKSIVVCGDQDAGKTTLTRGLATAIDASENIGTVETTRELHLDKLGRWRRVPVAWESREGSGERTASGELIGEVTVDQLLIDSLRFGLNRLFVGEVRGKEILAMFKAMQSGAGSMSTIHATCAKAAIDRMVTLAMEAGPHVTNEYARRQIAYNIDLIVHVGVYTDATGKKCRYVDEIMAVESGEDGGMAYTTVYRSDAPGELASPKTPPSWVDDLAYYGLELGHWRSSR